MRLCVSIFGKRVRTVGQPLDVYLNNTPDSLKTKNCSGNQSSDISEKLLCHVSRKTVICRCISVLSIVVNSDAWI